MLNGRRARILLTFHPEIAEERPREGSRRLGLEVGGGGGGGGGGGWGGGVVFVGGGGGGGGGVGVGCGGL